MGCPVSLEGYSVEGNALVAEKYYATTDKLPPLGGELIVEFANNDHAGATFIAGIDGTTSFRCTSNTDIILHGVTRWCLLVKNRNKK